MINLAELNFSDRLNVAARLNFGRFDAMVLLHSVFSNQQNLNGMLLRSLAACRVPKVYFIGNEYKLMPEKIRFCRQLKLALLITQSNDNRVMALYRAALDCDVICIPNTGIDPGVFRAIASPNQREIDIGYRSPPALWYLGNNERTEIAEFFSKNASLFKINTDISLLAQDRFDTSNYALFLNRCRGYIGTEPGGDYFELTDTTRIRVNKYLEEHPNSTWPEIKRTFFDNYGASVPMRIISGRHVEAAACKTVQILLEGRYNGILEPNVHYIALDKNYSNFSEVIEKFRDRELCWQIAENAYDVVMSGLTYDHLLVSVSNALKQLR